MSRAIQAITATVITWVIAGCATAYNPLQEYEQVTPANPDSPTAAQSDYPDERVEQGRYLVSLLGCGSCHTDGALVGKPDAGRLLAGSRVGIAWSNPLEVRNPGVVYPSNITPDPETGIGDWTVEQIVARLQSGVDEHGGRRLPVMPRLTYAQMHAEDATAIAMYLKSLPPVRHDVPAEVRPGERAKAPYIHFGVYRSKQ